MKNDHEKCVNRYEKALNKKYYNNGKPLIAVATIPLSKYINYDNYYSNVSKTVREHYKKALKKGYEFKEIVKRNHIDDIIEINNSSESRQGKPMADSYTKMTPQSFGGYPNEPLQIPSIVCDCHHTRTFGVFKDEKLVAYCVFVRDGNLCGYSQIIGHNEYLKDGIMYYMHINMMEIVFNKYKGCDYFIYAGWKDGTDGLKFWKARTRFEQGNLYVTKN